VPLELSLLKFPVEKTQYVDNIGLGLSKDSLHVLQPIRFTPQLYTGMEKVEISVVLINFIKMLSVYLLKCLGT